MDRICFEKFEKTVTLHLSKDKKHLFKNIQENFLILWFTLRIEKSKLSLYEMSVILIESLSLATMFRGDLQESAVIPRTIDL